VKSLAREACPYFTGLPGTSLGSFPNFCFLFGCFRDFYFSLAALPWLRAAGNKQLKGGRCPVRRSLLASRSRQ